MKVQGVTPAEMARRMRTSRPTVYRLLDPAERGATLDTLERASLALGMDLEIRLVPGTRPRRVQLRIEKAKVIVERADAGKAREQRRARFEKAKARMYAHVGGTLRKLAR